MTYRPLPDGLCIRYDDATGEHGLFALERFLCGHKFGAARGLPDMFGLVNRWPLGAFVNCDDDSPTCEMDERQHPAILVAVKDIEPGDELTVSYTLPEYCLLYTSPSPRDATLSRMPSSA